MSSPRASPISNGDSQPDQTQKPPSLFRIQWMGYGDGMVAEQDLDRYTFLMGEAPLLQGPQIWTAMDYADQGIHTCHQDDDDYLRTECHFSPEQCQQFWSMHDQYQDDPPTADYKRLWGIVYTNSFCNCDLTTTVQPCLYWLASKFNHSCQPNVGFDFCGAKLRLFTVRAVAADEELCICYNDVVYHHPAPVRKAFLKFKHHFDCGCLACNSPTETSDRRRRIQALASQVTQEMGISCLYTASFEEEVQRVAREAGLEGSANDELLPNTVGKDQSKRLLDILLEYISLLHDEGVDHDMLECYEMAYDLAASLTDDDSKSDQRQLGQTCLKLYELHKGRRHTSTVTFRLKLQANERV